MKIFNKLISALMVLPVVAALTACSDDDGKYTPAEKLTTAQVYFSNQMPTTVTLLTEGEGVVNVTLNRIKTDEALTVNLVATQPEEQALQFNVPASVTFAEGENSVGIDVTYDPSEVEYDTNYKLTIAISDEEYTTPYGTSAYSFTGSAPAPWESLGMATFTENCLGAYYGGKAVTYQVEMQENKTKPGYYRLVNPYGAAYPYNEEGDWDDSQDYYLYIHAEDPDFVYMPYQGMGVDWGDGEFALMDFAFYYMAAQGMSPENVKAQGHGGKLQDGIITWPTKGLLFAIGEDGYYYGNVSGEFEIVLPGYTKADYTVTAGYAGILTTAEEESQAVVDFTFGADVASAKYALTDASVSEDGAAAAIVSGELEATEITEGGRFYLPLEEDGKYRVTVVVFDAEGEAKGQASTGFEFEKGGSSWESLGVGLYTDDLVGCLFAPEDNPAMYVVTYEVEVLASTKTPGIYRLKNPYGEAFPLNEEGDWDASMDYYLEIDATDPTAVSFEKQALGLDWSYGMMYAKSIEDGTLVDGVITFPAEGTVTFDDDGGYYSNVNGAFKLVLPDADSSSDEVKAARFASRMRAYSRISHNKHGKKYVAARSSVRRALKKASVAPFKINF